MPLGLRTFGMTPEQAETTAVLAANQGLYNGFLAAGLVVGLVIAEPAAFYFRLFFLACVIVAGLFGAATVSKRILLGPGVSRGGGACRRACRRRVATSKARYASLAVCYLFAAEYEPRPGARNGWRGRIRTFNPLIQSQVLLPLATRQREAKSTADGRSAD